MSNMVLCKGYHFYRLFSTSQQSIIDNEVCGFLRNLDKRFIEQRQFDGRSAPTWSLQIQSIIIYNSFPLCAAACLVKFSHNHLTSWSTFSLSAMWSLLRMCTMPTHVPLKQMSSQLWKEWETRSEWLSLLNLCIDLCLKHSVIMPLLYPSFRIHHTVLVQFHVILQFFLLFIDVNAVLSRSMMLMPN